MRTIIQRTKQAKVEVDGEIIGTIDNGLLVLIGFEEEENQEDFDWMIKKIVQLRIFDDENGVMNKSVKDVEGDLLIVSQFTLHANCMKGNRPSYIRAAKPDISIPYYEKFINETEMFLGKKIQTGKFGADMKISLINNGPVSIILDSKIRDF